MTLLDPTFWRSIGLALVRTAIAEPDPLRDERGI